MVETTTRLGAYEVMRSNPRFKANFWVTMETEETLVMETTDETGFTVAYLKASVLDAAVQKGYVAKVDARDEMW